MLSLALANSNRPDAQLLVLTDLPRLLVPRSWFQQIVDLMPEQHVSADDFSSLRKPKRGHHSHSQARQSWS